MEILSTHNRDKTIITFALLFILILALAVRFVMFSGFIASDDFDYSSIANHINNGTFQIGGSHGTLPQFSLRFGLILPLAASFKLLGINDISLALFPLLCSLSSIVLIFLAGKLFFNSRTGLIAATLWAILPESIRLSTQYYPDTLSAFWLNISIILLYSNFNSSVKKKCFFGTIAGLTLGISWLSKASVVYLLPFIFGFLLWNAWRKKDWSLLLSTFITLGSIFAAEFLIYHIYTGDILHRFHTTEANSSEGHRWMFVKNGYYGWKEGGYFQALIKRLFLNGPRALFTKGLFGNTTVFAVIAILYAILRKQKNFIFVSIWFLWCVFIFNFGSSSLSLYRPLILFYRYLVPIAFPAVLLTAGLLGLMLQPKSQNENSFYKERVFWGLIFLLAVLANFGNQIKNQLERHSPFIFKDIRAYSKMIPAGSVIYADQKSGRAFEFHDSFQQSSQIIAFDKTELTTPKPGSYVVLSESRVKWLYLNYEYHVPTFALNIPKSWQLVSSEKESNLYKIPQDH